jgi:Flp pilus assembly protein CpaB
MTEEPTSGLQNWKLLVIALVLAVVAAIVYNFHISEIQRAALGNREERLVYRRDIQVGEKITAQDVEPVSVDTRYLARFDGIVKPEDKDSIIGKPVNQKVAKDHWLMWSHFQEDAGKTPSCNIKAGMIAHTIDVNPQMTPGNMLRVGDRVNVYAILPYSLSADANKKIGPLPIIEGVKVLAIGGRTISDHPTGRGDETSASYRSLTLELPEKVSLKLVNVLTYRSGDPWVDLCKSGEGLTAEDIDLTANVAHLVKAPAAPVTP